MNNPRRRCSVRRTARASFGVGANRSRRGCTDVACRVPSAACALALCFALAGCSAPPGPAPWFDEQAKTRGLDFRHQSGFAGRHLLPEIIGGGVALADFDGDGDLDIYFVQGGSVLEPADHGNRLYFNRGDGAFEAAPDAGAANRGYGIGVAAGDYDNDGDVDLYVTNYGPNVLLRNDGSGAFEDVSERAGVADDGFGTAATFFDLEPDGDLDLFVANYVEWHPAIERDCYIDGFLTYCPPQNYGAPAPDRLYRNNGDGTFADATSALGLNAAFGNGLGAVAADFNRDGLADLFVANDMMVNQLWINTGAGLIDEAPYRGVAVDEHGMAKAGMGVATGDVDADGDTDLLVVNLRGQTDSFFRNQGEWFEDATEAVGLSASSRRHTRFGVVLADFDNDGWLDLYQANGRVAPREPRPGEDEFAEPKHALPRQRRGLPGTPPRRLIDDPFAHQPRPRSRRRGQRRRFGLGGGEPRRRPLSAAQPRPQPRQLGALPRPPRLRPRRPRRNSLRHSRFTPPPPRRTHRRQLPRLKRPPRPLRPRHGEQGARRARALARRHGGGIRRFRRGANVWAEGGRLKPLNDQY